MSGEVLEQGIHQSFDRITTPVDELTGIPLLISPSPETLFLLDNFKLNAERRAAGGKNYADWNHAYHPRLSKELTSKDGKPTRDCRGQFIMRSVHDEYHAAYLGPPLPRTNEQRFRSLVFCAAGYVPRQVIDFSGDSPKQSMLNNEQIRRLQTSGEVRIMDKKSVKDFFERYILSSPEIDHIQPKLINDFLRIHKTGNDDYKRKCALAHQLLSLIIKPCTAPLVGDYKKSLGENLWRPQANAPGKVVHDEIACSYRSHHKRSETIREIGNLLYNKFAA